MNPIRFAAGISLAALAIASFPVSGQTYPSRAVRVIEPYPPGGVLDSLVRAVSQRLQEATGQPFMVENRAGANGIVGLDACAKSASDGYTLCMTTNDSISINPFLYSQMPFDPAKDLAPVAPLAWANGIIVAHPSVPASNLRELLALSRQKAGAVTWGTWGNGSTSHLYLGWINSETRSDLTHVPYKGSAPLLQAMLAGEVSSGLLASGILMPHLKAGKLKALAVVGSQRSAALPDTPSLPENGLDFYVKTWFGTFAPAGMAAASVQRINTEIAKATGDAKFKAQFMTPAGFDPAIMAPAEFAAFLKEDREAGARLVRAANIKLD